MKCPPGLQPVCLGILDRVEIPSNKGVNRFLLDVCIFNSGVHSVLHQGKNTFSLAGAILECDQFA